MKKLLLTSLSIFLGFCLFAQNLPEVFSSMSVTIKEGHSPPEVTNYVKAANKGLQKYGRGIGLWISYGDRGEQIQKFAWGFTFDFKEVRDYYFPKADDNSDGANPQFNAMAQKMTSDGYAMNQDCFESGDYTDWVCVGFDHLINPQIGGLVGVRNIPIKNGMEMDFEKYVANELYPAFQKNHPGFNVYVYKGDRGAGKDSYTLLMSFDSVSKRNEFFPGSGSNGTEAFTKAYAMVASAMDKFNDYTESAVTAGAYTDYVSIDVGN